jgi:hypothetical protein
MHLAQKQIRQCDFCNDGEDIIEQQETERAAMEEVSLPGMDPTPHCYMYSYDVSSPTHGSGLDKHSSQIPSYNEYEIFNLCTLQSLYPILRLP